MMTATLEQVEYAVHLRRPHPRQVPFIRSAAPRKIIRAGRRGGKTVGVAILAVKAFLADRRVLYGAPTQEQVDAFWFESKRALIEAVEAGVFYKNESMHIIERAGTKNRIRAKTCWNSDTLRGDTADLLILDEYQLMDEDAWGQVGAPMLLDNDGDAVFVFTPPSLHSRSVSKARDPRHASKMFASAQADTTGRWAAFHFASHDNPHISRSALDEITGDMTALAYRQEIMAEDVDEVPGALWTRAVLASTRVVRHPNLARVIVGVDPPGGPVTECGIVISGLGVDGQYYVIDDKSMAGSPDSWAAEVCVAYHGNQADRVVGEANFGGSMVEATIRQAARARGEVITYKDVHASRGKAVRAEPVAAMFEQGRAHLVGEFPALEDELCGWVPGVTQRSPNRMDAMVWSITELLDPGPGIRWLD